MPERVAAHVPTVQVIGGSLRAGRLCPRLAAWVIEIGRASTGLSYDLVDLADWPLPMDDEAGIPALGGYDQEHTRAWSRKIAGADAFVFVTPQYNRGYPAALKNAMITYMRNGSESPWPSSATGVTGATSVPHNCGSNRGPQDSAGGDDAGD